MTDVIELTMALCSIPSTTGEEKLVGEYLAKLLIRQGFEVELQTLPGTERKNVYAYRANNRPKILLTTHMDTVPPYFSPKISNDKEWLVGRGVCDAKGIMAAMICAVTGANAEKFKEVALLFVVGEETTSDGAKYASSQLATTFNYIVNGEPTDLKLASSMKGAIVFEMTALGKSGHSAYPETGDSALHALVSDASRLISHPWPKSTDFGETTINIGTLHGGEAPNVIAPDARMNGVMRLGCSLKQAQEIISGLVGNKTSVKYLSVSEPRLLDTEGHFDTCQVAFGCDIPHLEKLGVPLLFGPGSILEAHTDSEKIRVLDLHKAVSGYAEICELLLKKIE